MQKRTEDYVIPLLILFFIFLLLVQGVSFYLQARDADKAFHDSMESTMLHYAEQANLTSQTMLETHQLLAQHYQSDLIKLVQDKGEKALPLQLDAAFQLSLNSGYLGYLVYDLSGRLKYASDGMAASEFMSVQACVDDYRLNGNVKQPIFISPAHQLYALVAISDHMQTYGYLVLRRPFDSYSDGLKSAYSPGYALGLLDTARSTWLADETGLLSDRLASPLEHPGINIDQTSWQVVAKEDDAFLFWEIMGLLQAKLFFLGAYILLALWSVRVIRFMQRAHIQSLALASEKSDRAEQALSCIEEVVITTDMQGHIIYSNNNKAEQWLLNEHQSLGTGQLLQEQLPIIGATWMRPFDEKRLLKTPKNQELLLDVDGQLLSVELNHHLLRKGKKIKGVVWLLRNISEQVVARDELEDSRTRYRALYEGAGVGMWHVDIASVRLWLSDLGDIEIADYLSAHPSALEHLVKLYELIDMNEAAMNLHGVKNKELLTTAIRNLFVGENKQLILLTTQAIQRGDQQFSLEAKVKNVFGQDRHYVVSVTFDAVGVDQALISFIDISDRIEAEQALKQSERFWSQVLQALPDTVYVNDLIEKHTVYSSRHVSELLGYSEEEAKQFRHWRELVLDEDKTKVAIALAKLRNMKVGEVLETQLKMKHRDGHHRIMRFRDCVFTTDENGLSKYYVGIGRDVTNEENAKSRLAFNERQYRLLAEGISDIVVTLDPQQQLSFVSPSVEKILGATPEQVMQKGLAHILDPESVEQMKILARKDLHDAKMDRYKTNTNHRVRSLDLHARSLQGKEVVLEVQSSVLCSETGDIEGILAIGRDVTQRRRIEHEVRTAAEVFENSSEAIVVSDPEKGVQQVNRAFTHMTGYALPEIQQKDPLGFLAPDLSIKETEEIRDALQTDGYWQGELNYRNRQGQMRPSWTGVTALKDNAGNVQSHITISSDITDRKVSEARIQRLAYFDPLTGLPNRQQMHEALERLMLEHHESAAMLFIDLDRFKPINDTMGHPVGDRVLKEVALRLRASIRPQDLVARIGGDEFTVIMPGFANSDLASNEAVEGSERILHQLMQPFVIEDRNLYLSASIGVALYPQDAVNGTDLLRNADTAMYHAKAMGKNNFQFYAEEMNVKALQRLEMENQLHQALTQNEFELVYQPQWDTARNSMCGIEALLRWRRPGIGLVGPDVFVPIIEETGLIVPVGEWVLRVACEQIIDWQEAGLDVPTVAVNISARQFKDEQMLDRICRIVDETGVDPELIELELTESILMDDVERTLAVLHETRRMGFHISIDDFGTGYSSLSYLKQFPVDNLKVDASFIRNLPMNQEDGQITRTIVSMANNLGLGVIAEGVETQAQQDFLQDVGCYRVQGFRYSRPVTAEQLSQQFLDHEAEVEFELESPIPA